MKITPESSNKISELIQKFANHPQDLTHTKNLQETVAKLDALPMAFNFDCYAIKPSGKIIVFEVDNSNSFEVETNPRIINTVLFQGIKKFSELKELMPVRSADDIDCSACNGTGVNPIAEKLKTENIICWCGGLGWIPKDAN